MYWPIGPAKAYEQHLPTHASLQTNDGLDQQSGSSKDTDSSSEANGHHESETSSDGPTSPQPKRKSTVNGDHQRRKSRAEPLDEDDGSILAVEVSRNGHVFATITKTTLTVWQTKPTAILTSVIRTHRSLKNYGSNVGLLLRPDADIVVIQSAHGYLITYSLLFDPASKAYQIHLADGGRSHRRRSSVAGPAKYGLKARGALAEGGGDVQEARLHFRMVIRLDAGISKALALDHELIVITKEPAAVQCIRWNPDRSGAQFSTEMLGSMEWLEGNRTLSDVVHDKPMNVFAFVSAGGRAYAVQRITDSSRHGKNPDALFDGHIFHIPKGDRDIAVKSAINSRFSLIALGCKDGSIRLYSVQNYAGGIRFLHKIPLPASAHSAGHLTSLSYSPDGYCLFAGYSNGWTTWSVYGQPGGSSFGCEKSQCQQNGDDWLTGISTASWMSGGSEVLMLTPKSNLIWSQEFARSAVTGCYNPANVSKGLLQTSSGLIVYQGDQMTDLATITADASIWQHVQAPPHYLIDQWPIRMAIISPDRRYLAIAGLRGLAHYSMASGRWRTFQDPNEQNDFAVRGGMCWHHHVLIAAVETSYGTQELRLYSRELPLENSKVLHSIALSSPVVNLSTSGDDGILSYTYDNTLDHYIVDAKQKTAQLVKVGQITLSGIIRAPARVRAVSWIVPDEQLQQGDASQDVTSASVLFLVDGKLVLLQPALNENDELKYDMRVIASSIEYFILARDDPAIYAAIASGDFDVDDNIAENVLKDSLWAFDGHTVKVWPDIQELLNHEGLDVDTSIDIDIDFYPFSAPLQKGLIVGAEAELTQRRDVNFAYFRTVARTTLFPPAILRYHLTHYDIASALRLSHPFRHLPYFTHALEILLHTVLDEEVEKPATAPSTPAHTRSNTDQTITADRDYLTASPANNPPMTMSFLPTVLNFLTNFPDHYLDIVLQCTRKTELRSWRTLFQHLPPPSTLFEQALQAGDLKTAGGYLLVLQQHQTEAEEAEDGHVSLSSEPQTPDGPEPSDRLGTPHHLATPTFEPPKLHDPANDTTLPSAQVVPQAVRLLRRAQAAGEWELCKELARFLMALDQSGGTLRGALEAVERGGKFSEGVDGIDVIDGGSGGDGGDGGDGVGGVGDRLRGLEFDNADGGREGSVD